MIIVPDLRSIEHSAQSEAERRFARLLAAIPQSDAVAFHSVKLRSHGYKQFAEADFVILWKGVVVVVEVKGGGVKKIDGTWYTVDRHGDAHRLSSSPMEQARSAMFALRNILRQDGLGWFPSEAITVTPDIAPPPPSTEWRSTHWLAKDEMTADRLTSALDDAVSTTKAPPSGIKRASTEEIRTRLFGEFARLPVIDAQRGAVIDEQNRATEGQARVLAGLARNPRMVILGGAGTGKSLLLAEAAKQEPDSGRSVLVTFSSPRLRQLFESYLSGHNIDVVAFQDLPSTGTYDVAFVDEAQDLMAAEHMDRLDTILAGGMSNGRWRMFMDPNNQAHVEGTFDPEVFELVLSEATTYDLALNVRNTRAIVHIVQEYLGADVGDPGIVNGERVTWHWTHTDDTLGEAISIGHRLSLEGARASEIWIVPVSADPETDVIIDGLRVLSPRSAKGLETEHVIVTQLPDELDSTMVASLYVALTRARVSLHVVATGQDKKRLQLLARKVDPR